MEDQGQLAKDRERYLKAAHRVQTCIAFNPDQSDQEPKHMRVGIDMGKSDQAGLATLLMEKGLFTLTEYTKAVADAAEREAAARENELSTCFGINVSTV